MIYRCRYSQLRGREWRWGHGWQPDGQQHLLLLSFRSKSERIETSACHGESGSGDAAANLSGTIQVQAEILFQGSRVWRWFAKIWAKREARWKRLWIYWVWSQLQSNPGDFHCRFIIIYVLIEIIHESSLNSLMYNILFLQ